MTTVRTGRSLAGAIWARRGRTAAARRRIAARTGRPILKIFICGYGGGGGNRTRVRKHSTSGLYTLIPFIVLAARLSKRKSAGQPVPKVFRSPVSGPSRLAIPPG